MHTPNYPGKEVVDSTYRPTLNLRPSGDAVAL